MTQLSNRDVDSIIQLCDIASDSRKEPQLPDRFFQRITQLFESRSAVYYCMGDDVAGQGVWDGLGYELNPQCVTAYEQNYRQYDPCYLALTQKARQGEALIVSTDEVISSRHHYINSEYYNDFLKPQGIDRSLIFGIQDSEGTLGLVGFHRQGGSQPYQPKHYLMARLLSTQLAQVMRRQRLEEDLASQQQQSHFLMRQASVDACLTIDQDGLIHAIFGTPANLSDWQAGNSIVGDSVKEWLHPDACHHIETVLSPTTQSMQAPKPQAVFDNLSQNHGLRIRPFKNQRGEQRFHLLFLKKTASLLSQARLEEFSLTPREQDVVQKISQGYTTAQCAKALDISPKTVERHLGHIYQKTMVSNRAELIKQLSH
ncbi:helix-turn-helix transcriptional regulator [Pseudoteredinibacter isoporae]|uniref:helix-turn-helix transcriptional regulator n=1 Tax=Pseudoteredinibacter isoporae TaxID=570281 RepID=UPI0031046E52